MHLVILLFFGFFVFPSIHAANHVRSAAVRLGSNPGIIVRLKKAALDSLFNDASKLAGKYAHKIPIPDIQATISGVDIQTKDLRLTHVAQPKIKYDFSSPNKINGSIEFPSIGIEGPFYVTRRTLVSTQNDSGIVNFNATQIHVSFQASIGSLENGIPNVDTFECQSQLGPSNLRIRNAKESFTIETIKVVASRFRNVYESVVCSTAKRLVTSQLNQLLTKLPNMLELSTKLAFKFQVKPEVAKDYIQFGLYAKVLTDQISPFTPARFVESPSGDSLVVLLISDSIFNDLAYQAFVNGKLGFTIDKDSHSMARGLVQLKCDPKNDACLGNVAPKLADIYGEDADVEAVFKATKAPEIEFVQDKANIKLALVVELKATPVNETESVHEATVAVDVTGDLNIGITNDTLHGKLTVQQVTVHIDDEHSKKWEEKIKSTIKKVVEEQFNNRYLEKGLHLRLPCGIAVTAPLVKFAPHTLQIQTGFEIKANSSEDRTLKSIVNYMLTL